MWFFIDINRRPSVQELAPSVHLIRFLGEPCHAKRYWPYNFFSNSNMRLNLHVFCGFDTCVTLGRYSEIYFRVFSLQVLLQAWTFFLTFCFGRLRFTWPFCALTPLVDCTTVAKGVGIQSQAWMKNGGVNEFANLR